MVHACTTSLSKIGQSEEVQALLNDLKSAVAQADKTISATLQHEVEGDALNNVKTCVKVLTELTNTDTNGGIVATAADLDLVKTGFHENVESAKLYSTVLGD